MFHLLLIYRGIGKNEWKIATHTPILHGALLDGLIFETQMPQKNDAISTNKIKRQDAYKGQLIRLILLSPDFGLQPREEAPNGCGNEEAGVTVQDPCRSKTGSDRWKPVSIGSRSAGESIVRYDIIHKPALCGQLSCPSARCTVHQMKTRF